MNSIDFLNIFRGYFLINIWTTLCMSRNSHLEMFLGKGFLQICNKFTGKHPCQSAAIFKNTFSWEHLWVAASVYQGLIFVAAVINWDHFFCYHPLCFDLVFLIVLFLMQFFQLQFIQWEGLLLRLTTYIYSEKSQYQQNLKLQ